MGTGPQGYRNLVNNSRFLFNVDWSFVFVLTKYRAAFPGYAPFFRDVVISYSMEAAAGLLDILPFIFAPICCIMSDTIRPTDSATLYD
jgi:hypothetical protein